MEPMRVELGEFKCSCGHCYQAVHSVPVDYGTLWLRGEQTEELQLLDAANSAVFAEVSDIVESDRAIQKLPAIRQSYAIHFAFAPASDPDASGAPMRMSLLPKCPHCGRRDVNDWSTFEPPRFIEQAVGEVSHHAWSTMTTAEKRARVLELVREFLSTTSDERRRRYF